VPVLEEEELGEDSMTEGSDESGKGWLQKFSTMKWGLPREPDLWPTKLIWGNNKLRKEATWPAQGGPSGQWERKPKGILNSIMSDLQICAYCG